MNHDALPNRNMGGQAGQVRTNPQVMDNIYTWYDSDTQTNLANAGSVGQGKDTEDFTATLNTAG